MRSPTSPTLMIPTPPRIHRTSIPATGLGSILLVAPQLALVDDRGVAEVAVAVRSGSGPAAPAGGPSLGAGAGGDGGR